MSKTVDEEYIAIDPAMHAILRLFEQIGPTGLPVLLLGESGSGKEVLAQWLHGASTYSTGELLRVNCAGLTETLVESELFGHERGAFTNAAQAHAGLFERADGGSLFLDEIAELPLRTQAKLLRVLETGEFTRVGGTRARRANCRLVSATHRDLPAMVERGEFRGDLFFRLRGAVVEVPPLRVRRCEIIPLAELFIRRCARAWNKPVPSLAAAAAAALLDYTWPGNVRELKHVAELAVALSSDSMISHEVISATLPGTLGARASNDPSLAPALPLVATYPYQAQPPNIRAEMRAFERTQIDAALVATRGNQTSAAKLLGISRRTLSKKLTLHGFARPRRDASSGQ